MNSDRPFLLVAVILNSALYCAGVIAAGLMWESHLAVILALGTIGLAYLSATIQSIPDPLREVLDPSGTVAVVLVLASIATGVAAGLSLLW